MFVCSAPLVGRPNAGLTGPGLRLACAEPGDQLAIFGEALRELAVRRQTEAARARLAATADDVEGTKLLVQAEVASDYFTLRALDAELALIADTIDTYRRSLELTLNRRKGGIASDLEIPKKYVCASCALAHG